MNTSKSEDAKVTTVNITFCLPPPSKIQPNKKQEHLGCQIFMNLLEMFKVITHVELSVSISYFFSIFLNSENKGIYIQNTYAQSFILLKIYQSQLINQFLFYTSMRLKKPVTDQVKKQFSDRLKTHTTKMLPSKSTK